MAENQAQQATMLGPYRVLDLTDERGEIASMIGGSVLALDVAKVASPYKNKVQLPDSLTELPWKLDVPCRYR